MKILVFHQPYPMGNYKLNQVIAEYFQSNDHEVYILEQLNGRIATEDYIQQILDLDLDLCYYEMLDIETFKIVERLKCQKILLQASGGVLGDYNKIIDYKGKWYDKILTNSLIMESKFKQNNIPTQHFKFYHSAINENEKIYKSEYNHDCVFLGMGFNRLSDPQYDLERQLYFTNQEFDFNVYGNGWDSFPYWKGLLPPNDIGSLYTSAKCAIGIIAKEQRKHGMINNRYTEVASCGCPLISYNYPTINWFGADKFIHFIENKSELKDIVLKINNNYEEYKNISNNFKLFMEEQTLEFYNNLENLIQI
jgi:hypothetical protein